MSLELRHFRYFIAVAQDLHFTRAAARLGIATPTLTRQIQDMEAMLGARLLNRTQRTVALTPAGRVLFKEAMQVVAQFDNAQRNTQREARGETGLVNLGYVASAAYSGVLQRHVQAFRSDCPNALLSVNEAVMPSLPRLVSEGQLDLGYVRAPLSLPDGVESIALIDEPFILALPAQCWLSQLPEITPAHLKDELFILPEQISGTLAAAERGGFVPRLGPQPGGLVAVLTLVSLGEGVAIVPDAVKGHIDLPNLVYRALDGFSATSNLSVVFRQYETAPMVRRFISLLGRAMGTKQ